MKVVDILREECIKVELDSREKDAIIKELIELLAKSPSLANSEAISRSIFERERTMSTGIGNGVAIPHGKSSGVSNLCAALGMIKEGADFDAIDKRPVYIFILLASPEGPGGPHIKALSRISRMLNKSFFREKLLNCRTAGEVIECIKEEEKDYFEM